MALFWVNGTFYALQADCPHAGAPLEEGEVRGEKVVRLVEVEGEGKGLGEGLKGLEGEEEEEKTWRGTRREDGVSNRRSTLEPNEERSC
eukprot:768480-Hanusia_phi.AAC.3